MQLIVVHIIIIVFCVGVSVQCYIGFGTAVVGPYSYGNISPISGTR